MLSGSGDFDKNSWQKSKSKPLLAPPSPGITLIGVLLFEMIFILYLKGFCMKIQEPVLRTLVA